MRSLMLLVFLSLAPMLPAARWVFVESWPWIYDNDSSSWHLAVEPGVWVWSPQTGWGIWGEEVQQLAPASIAGRQATVLTEGGLVVSYRFYQGIEGRYTNALGHVDFTYIYRRESAARASFVLNLPLTNGQTMVAEGVLTFQTAGYGTYVVRSLIPTGQLMTDTGEFWVE